MDGLVTRSRTNQFKFIDQQLQGIGSVAFTPHVLQPPAVLCRCIMHE
jgi:hypothetical protein